MAAFNDLVSNSITEGDLLQVVAIAINRDGQVIQRTIAGHTQLPTPSVPDSPPVAISSVFYLASCTKIITTLAALLLFDRNLLHLHAPVAPLLPALAAQPLITVHPNSTNSSTPTFSLSAPGAGENITLHNLMTHTSGLTYDVTNPALLAWRASRGEPPLAGSGKISGLLTPLVVKPSSSWTHGASTDFVGEAVRITSGQKLGEFLQDEVLGPLGVHNTTFHLEQREDVRAELVQMVQRRADGALEAAPAGSAFADPAEDDIGGAGMYASAEEYVKVLAELIAEEPKVLKNETLDRLFSAEFEAGSPQSEGLLKNFEAAQAMTGLDPSVEGAGEKFGISMGGLYIKEDVNGWEKGTLVWGGVSNCIWFANREKGFAGFYGTNLLPFADAKSQSVFQRWRLEVQRLAGEARTTR